MEIFCQLPHEFARYETCTSTNAPDVVQLKTVLLAAGLSHPSILGVKMLEYDVFLPLIVQRLLRLMYLAQFGPYTQQSSVCAGFSWLPAMMVIFGGTARIL